jgi:hypothetical protein
MALHWGRFWGRSEWIEMPAPRSHHNVVERESATRSRHVARCAKAPVGSPAGALLYLMPRSLGAACLCSPSVTQCEPVPGRYRATTTFRILASPLASSRAK